MALQDDDTMPFGKHRGVKMQDVPVHYLHWLWQNGQKHDKKSEVAGYIRENLAVLKSKNDDLIWD